MQEWRHLEEAVQKGVVSGFGKKLSSILESSLTGYVFFLMPLFWFMSFPCSITDQDKVKIVNPFATYRDLMFIIDLA